MSIRKVLRKTIKSILQATIISLPVLPAAVFAADNDNHPMHMQMHSMPDAPIGIMGHHIHQTGGFMMSYSYMTMQMEDNLIGTSRAPDNLLPDFRVTPLDMDMTMNMLGMMYGYSDKITLMAMIPVTTENNMNLKVNMNGLVFQADAKGVGDLKLSALIKGGKDFVFKFGLGVPTGSIDETGVNPASNGRAVVLPYPMQLGTGSFELSLGGVYARKIDKVTTAVEADLKFMLNDNDRDYRVGNRIEFSAWSSYKTTKETALSVRLKLSDWGNISGRDPALEMALNPPNGAPTLVPTVVPTLRGGTRLDLLLGIKYGGMHGAVVGLEFGVPIYQNLDGPQLETDLIFQLGLQYGF